MARTNFLFALFFLHSTALVAGTNDAVYLHEGFNSPSLPSGWNIRRISGTDANWSFVGQGSNPTVNPYAGPGQAKFNSFAAASGEQARLTTRSINLSSATDPFLSFWMYHDDEYVASFDSLYVEASTSDSVTGPWTILAGVRRPKNENRWRQEILSLYQYRGASRIFLSLRGVSKYGNNLYIDEFRVADSTFHDIGTAGLTYDGVAASPDRPYADQGSRAMPVKKVNGGSAPDAIIPDAPTSFRVFIRNYGTFAEAGYAVSWRVNGQLQPSQPSRRTLAARTGLDTLLLPWDPPGAGLFSVTAWSVNAADSNRANDTTQLTVNVLDTSTVFYESFNGGSFPPASWLTVNRDGGTLAPWFRGADTSTFVPFEGTGFAGNNFARANNSYLDDYLISPPIPGINTTGRSDSLIFWSRSINNTPPAINYPDSLMVLLSTTGADTSNFTIRVDYFPVPKTGWTRRAYPLSNRVPPNSTVRVAFRYLLYNVLPNGGSGDFVGVDAVQVVKKLPTGVKNEGSPPAFSLDQNYPNPFNPLTNCQFSIGNLPAGVHGTQAGSQLTTLKVYDVLGREVATLVHEVKPAGTHSVVFDATNLPSGMYVYRLTSGGYVQARKMLLLR